VYIGKGGDGSVRIDKGKGEEGADYFILYKIELLLKMSALRCKWWEKKGGWGRGRPLYERLLQVPSN
jgi:hypothetical protein